MKCQACEQESVMRPVDIAIEDDCAEDQTSDSIIIYWSCPKCGEVHTTHGTPIQWEI